jgi:hypothetical protein
MKKRISQAERMRIYTVVSMYQVMDLLEWDMMTYCQFKYECGLIYLEAYLSGDMAAIDQITRSATYWGWWKLHWYLREKEFLDMAQYSAWKYGVAWRTADARHIFHDENDPLKLAKGETANGVFLEESYCINLAPSLR